MAIGVARSELIQRANLIVQWHLWGPFLLLSSYLALALKARARLFG